ncbi:MAG TPA: hypothetical protein VJ867_09070 [Gemmatimonadaceae bacterium]|nr:hypothetical protein [Gemmatimonadaceae bacterium]
MRYLLLVAAVMAAGACMKDPPPYTDTLVASPQSQAAPADSARPSKIGQLAVLGPLSPDGACSVEQLTNAAVLRNVTYEGDYPRRRIVIGVGAADRQYRPINLDISISQDASAGQVETESLRVIFLPDGDIRQGVHAYDGPSGAEQTGLTADDTSRVKQLVADVLDHCKDHD